MLRLFECKRKGIEWLGGAQPDESAAASVDVRLEYARMPVTRPAIDAVCGYEQIRIGERLFAVHFMFEHLPHTQLPRALLQNGQQALAAYAGESMAAAH